MLTFKKLKLTGFKSFVDSTDMFIETGLTGVVGPNGCGKSNLVEALKWVMGETSAKQMRGSEMEDVIFSGTADRPSRNIAEVSLVLDNANRQAPPQFNDADELEVSRRIEREKGSQYRINGKEVRARDVQLLFADQATGARSTALVSQGRIGAVINAKPAQRRLLLEEAAGITGLHSRRHEAELRLRGAETNMERLDDILATLDTQMQSLRKQARQATRYRNLSDHIRTAEAAMFHVLWTRADEQRSTVRRQLKEAGDAVQALTGVAVEATANQAKAAEGLPELRQAEAAQAAELQRLTHARETLDAEEERVHQATEEARDRMVQVDRDEEREKSLMGDADAAVERLGAERETIETARANEGADLEAAAEARAEADEAVAELDREVNRLTEEVANGEARRSALEQRLNELNRRMERLEQRRDEANRQKAELETRSADLVDLAQADAEAEAARTGLEQSREKLAGAEADRLAAAERTEAAAEQAEAAAERLRAKVTDLTALEAEIRTLERVLQSMESDGDLPPLLDSVEVAAGFEDALGAAIGEDLSAPVGGDDDIRWDELPPLAGGPALPAGVKALAEVVEAPAVLARRLSQIGVVDSAEEGRRLQPALAAGQRLVSRGGGLWRWDGYVTAEGAETAAAQRLAQRNRLAEVSEQAAVLDAEKQELEARAAKARDAVQAARGTEQEARQVEQQARQTVQDADRAYNQSRDHLAEMKDRAAAVQSKLATLEETLSGLAHDLEETATQKAEAEGERAALPDMEAARADLTEQRTQLAEKRAHQVECRSRHEQLKQAADARRRRLEALAQEVESWSKRRAAAETQLRELNGRRRTLAEELEGLARRPAEIAEQRQGLLTALEESEAKRRAAADTLAEAEARLAEADRGLREAERNMSEAQQVKVRAEGAVEQAEQAANALIERIRDRLQVQPTALFELSGLKEDAALPDLADAERKVDRLHRERDTMGPVNLRAEQEMTELTEQITTLESEKEDLLAAIAKLRQAISELNREGRARLLASFEEVNGHFQKLFVRLFGGGRAHLELVESDDPLEAGLEIFASPPGKRLQVMSLLSGGEQALTALSLLFAVFQTNPAPICVLDEVDAPLDDANVDRFCSMLEEMVNTGETRFIIITHHRMSMARMHRLFGVTMQERGVSQLVSVDLQQAEDLRQTA